MLISGLSTDIALKYPVAVVLRRRSGHRRPGDELGESSRITRTYLKLSIFVVRIGYPQMILLHHRRVRTIGNGAVNRSCISAAARRRGFGG
jgi:hypothetical protein